jgi:hypothetical protein
VERRRGLGSLVVDPSRPLSFYHGDGGYPGGTVTVFPADGATDRPESLHTRAPVLQPSFRQPVIREAGTMLADVACRRTVLDRIARRKEPRHGRSTHCRQWPGRRGYCAPRTGGGPPKRIPSKDLTGSSLTA